MSKTARYIYNPIRTVLVVALLAIVLTFAAAYLALSIPAVQNRIRIEGEKALSQYLGTSVTIGEVSIKPFDQLTLKRVLVPDQNGGTLMAAEKLGAGVDLYALIAHKQVVITYAELVGMQMHVTRPDKQTPTNMQFIIDRLKSGDNEPEKPFDLKINSVVIRKCALTYDVQSEPHLAGRFDPNHISLADLRADVSLPRLKNDAYEIDLKRLSLSEKSGFVLKNLATHVTVTPQQLDVRDIRLELPQSIINVGDVRLNYSSLGKLADELPSMSHELDISNSSVTPADLKAFVPQLATFDTPMQLTAALRGNPDDLSIAMLQVQDPQGNLNVNLSGHINGLGDIKSASIDLPHCSIDLRPAMISRMTKAFSGMSPQAMAFVERCGSFSVNAALNGTPRDLSFQGKLATAQGLLALNGNFADRASDKQFKGHIATDQFDVGDLIDNSIIGQLALDANVDATLNGRQVSGALDGHVAYIDIKGQRYHDIDAHVTAEGSDYSGHVAINDAGGRVEVDGTARLDGARSRFDITASVSDLKPEKIGLPARPVRSVSFNALATISGNRPEQASGTVSLTDIKIDHDGHLIDIDHLRVEADHASMPKQITIESPIIAGKAEGDFDYSTLKPSLESIFSETFPTLFSGRAAHAAHRSANDFDFHFSINPDEQLTALFKSPIRILQQATIDGHFSESSRSLDLRLNAPYLLQGGKNIIEQTQLVARLDSATNRLIFDAQTTLPSKKGKIQAFIHTDGVSDTLATRLGWRVDRERDFSGELDCRASFTRNPDGKIRTDIDVNPTKLVFSDTVWNVQQGRVTIDGGVVSVYNLAGQCDKQFVRINGKVSRDPSDVLCLQLNDVSLDYIFETLNIDNVVFGGRATGDFYASDLLSGSPRLQTELLHVDNLSYNRAVMGDADITSSWMNESKGVSLSALLKQKNGLESRIDGGIFVADDSLYLEFDAQRANIAFMKPFMQAFANDVQGEVSGHAVLLGNFHTINLYGDIVADSLRFKLDYTNVEYTCAGDSVHIVPDYIAFDNVRIHDRYGHEARMDGWLKHNSFHDPVFNFSITDAHSLLCYDTDAGINPVWYGTIFGNGAAFVTGSPGVVDIKVNMESASNSRFTFVISDAQQASEYNFITFHDRDKKAQPPQVQEVDTVPELIRQLTQQVMQSQQDRPTHYNIDLQGDITPDAQLVIVMDPDGGDQIKATGQGNMRLTYNDADEMTMYGKYVLDKGNYNFTLQDIIIKDFTIKEGSSISFQGDPYAAILDIEAVYSLNANLRDLDESFASDKEITRTNVPVHALLRAKGVMSEPEISFDLEFPTLTTDAYRKVRSIISTDDMMNRQIIYLLALNRFYTPDYMNASTNANELTSVASSTISSQLSNILGKMSDNWSISPNFRSNKGDFSDMEVDLALSSQLLNNRLLFNGNFGYRDNTYNTRNSNFIGDFDIEYLLNSKGTLRLKAYNHFNDQNYYVRNALTTQGLGIVWKHDFNRPFDFMRRRNPAPADTTQKLTMPVDTTLLNER